MGPGPRNAAGLARTALLALAEAAPCPVAVIPESVVLMVAGPVAPHVWRVAEGGVAVAPGRWVRRYAALPAGARLGAWVHELAHLLLGWPDLPGSPCLMGQGALRGGGHDPAPPGPALALAAGWLDLVQPAAAMPACALAEGAAMALDWRGRQVLITRREREFAVHDRLVPGPPLAAGRLADPAGPLLAGVAAGLERV